MKRATTRIAKPLPGDAMAEEIERYAMGFPLTLAVDSHWVMATIDREHELQPAHVIQLFDCDGSVARQIVRECRRITDLYNELAARVLARAEIDSEAIKVNRRKVGGK